MPAWRQYFILLFLSNKYIYIHTHIYVYSGYPGSSAGKESACNAGNPSSIPGQERSPGEGIGCPLQYYSSLVSQTVKNLPAMRETWVRKIPWWRAWLPSPVFLPGELHGQRTLVGYSPWGCKESDMTEQLSTELSMFIDYSQSLGSQRKSFSVWKGHQKDPLIKEMRDIHSALFWGKSRYQGNNSNY